MNRLTINTPSLFEQFTSGQIGSGYKLINILPGSHPDILSLPRLFANNTDVDKIRFEDENNNIAYLNQPNHVELYAKKGNGLLHGLPDSYIDYKLYILNGASLSSDDYEDMFRWKNVTYLEIIDVANIAFDLSQRVSEMKFWNKLSVLKLTVHLHSHTELKVMPFFLHLPVKLVEFDATELPLQQGLEFISQEFAKEVYATFSYNVVQFKKKIPHKPCYSKRLFKKTSDNNGY